MMEHPMLTEMVLKLQLAERLTDAERYYRLSSVEKAARSRTPSRAERFRIRIGHWLVTLGHRLECQSAVCASAGHALTLPVIERVPPIHRSDRSATTGT